MNSLVDILPGLVFAGFLSAGLISAVLTIRHEIGSSLENEQPILNLCFWSLCGAAVAARLAPFVMTPATFLQDPFKVLRLWEGGLSGWSGLLAAILVALVYISKERMPLLRTADILAPSIAIGQFFIGMGCFFSGLCVPEVEGVYWKASTAETGLLAAVFPPLQPRALLMATGSFILFVVLLYLRRRQRFEGQLFLSFAAMTGIYAAALEWVRLAGPGVGALSLSFTALVVRITLVLVAGLTYVFLHRRSQREMS